MHLEHSPPISAVQSVNTWCWQSCRGLGESGWLLGQHPGVQGHPNANSRIPHAFSSSCLPVLCSPAGAKCNLRVRKGCRNVVGKAKNHRKGKCIGWFIKYFPINTIGRKFCKFNATWKGILLHPPSWHAWKVVLWLSTSILWTCKYLHSYKSYLIFV